MQANANFLFRFASSTYSYLLTVTYLVGSHLFVYLKFSSDVEGKSLS